MAEPVALVFAVRGRRRTTVLAGLPETARSRGLSDADARELLDR